MNNPLSTLIHWLQNRFRLRGAPLNSDQSGSKAMLGNRRRFHRFNYSYNVTFMNGLKRFKTVCSNISLGGMKLKHPLPPSLWGIECKVQIEGSSANDTIVFNCKTLADSALPRRISFSDADQESQQRLERWLIERAKREGR